MQKVCDCGIPYAEHLRCVECWVLLHQDEKYCHIFNSDRVIGFTINDIRCFDCVPNSNKNRESEAKGKRGRKPLDESIKLLRRLEKEATKNREREERREKRGETMVLEAESMA